MNNFWYEKTFNRTTFYFGVIYDWKIGFTLGKENCLYLFKLAIGFDFV